MSPTPISVLRVEAVGDCEFPVIVAENRTIIWENTINIFTVVFLPGSLYQRLNLDEQLKIC